jgi:hypothetical protein
MARPVTRGHVRTLKFGQFTVWRELDVVDIVGSKVRNEISVVGKRVCYDSTIPKAQGGRGRPLSVAELWGMWGKGKGSDVGEG